MNRHALRIRFALGTAGLILAAATLFGIYVYVRMAQGLAESIDRGLMLAAAQAVVEANDERPHAPLIELEQGFSWRVLDRGRRSVQEYGPYKLPQPNISFSGPFQAGVFATITDASTGHTVRVYTAPVVEDNRVVGTIQVASNLNSVGRTLSQLLRTLLAGTLFAVLIAGAGGYVLAARALAPIDEMTQMAQRISIEDLSARLAPARTGDEVGRLATTFNLMLARLEEGVRRERRFTADASHELRTPLAVIQTILGSTLARRRSPEQYEQALRDVAEETDRMRVLTEGLLLLARSDSAPAAPHERLDLATLLRDVTDSLRPLAEAKGLALRCDVPPTLMMLGDGDGLVRLFANLVGNAIKYTERGWVAVSVRQEDGESVEVAVADTGVGIAPEHRPHVFERFYRTDAARGAAGAGLGLAIAASVAQAHGGAIEVESEVGRGSVFVVRLARQHEAKRPQGDRRTRSVRAG